MKKTRILAFMLIIVLIAASAIIYSCKKDDSGDGGENVLGKGATSFKLEITDNNGESKTFTIKTDEKTVGDALIHEDVKLIPAESKDTGYFDTLNGIKADFSVDEGWWKVLVNGEEAQIGVFDIEVEKDATYSFEYTKGFDMGGSSDLNDSDIESPTDEEAAE